MQFTCIVYLRNLRHCVHKHSAINTMEAVSHSEYYSGLSPDAKARYDSKGARCGLSRDPYVIPDESWVSEADITMIPDLKWSDMFLYLICTPTRDKLRVRYC